MEMMESNHPCGLWLGPAVPIALNPDTPLLIALHTDPVQVKVMPRYDVCPIAPETAGLSDGSPYHQGCGPGLIPAPAASFGIFGLPATATASRVLPRRRTLDGPRLLLPPAGEGRYRLSSGTDVVVVGVYVSCLVYGSACRVVRSASARPSKPVGPITGITGTLP